MPKGVEIIQGDLLDPVSVRKALDGVDKLYLLNAVVPDELTQGLIAYDLAKKLKLKQIVYHSVFKVEDFKDVPHFASKLTIEGESVSVTREVDGGLQTVKLKGPAIVTTDLRLNEPRYASLPNIMKAKKKPIADKSPADYGVDVAPRLEVLKTTEPSGRKAGVKVKTVGELVEKLKNEAGVL